MGNGNQQMGAPVHVLNRFRIWFVETRKFLIDLEGWIKFLPGANKILTKIRRFRNRADQIIAEIDRIISQSKPIAKRTVSDDKETNQ